MVIIPVVVNPILQHVNPRHEGGQGYANEIGEHGVFEVRLVAGRRGLASHHHLAWNPDHYRVRWNIFNHDRIRPDAAIAPNRDGAQNLGAGAYDDIVSDRRVAFTFGEACPSECDAVVKRYIIADFGRLADDDSHPVVDEKAFSYCGARVDFDAGEASDQLREPSSEGLGSVLPEPMRQPMPPQGVQTRIADQDFECVPRRGVSVKHRLKIAFQGLKHDRQLSIREMRKKRGAQVALAKVGDDHHYQLALIFFTPRNLQRSPHSCAR